MKVLHSGTLAASYGGPAMSTYLTLHGLIKLGVDAQIIQQPIGNGDVMRGYGDVPIHYYDKPIDKKICYAPHMKRDIELLGKMDIYHAQGIWRWHTYSLVDAAKDMGAPYLITPRGMLYPQDIKKANYLFKQASLKIRLLRDLNHAACVHVTCLDELKYCRALGVKSPIAIIPNPVEIKDYECKKEDNVFRLGYLGRLSKRKNVESLIYAFSELQNNAISSELLIIGSGDDEYQKFLLNETKRLALKNVRFTGFLNGEDKNKAIASCSVLAMPSEFENLGNVVLEGLVRRIPCIATTGAPWQELISENCGWQVPYTQKDITKAISLAMSTSYEKLKEMGENGRKLMERRYSVDAVAKDMKALYEWILGGKRPSFVYLEGEI